MKNASAIRFVGEVWLYSGANASWHFITLPPEAATRVRFYAGEKKRGWGSVPVVVTIGRTCWRTSIFPEKKSKSFLLPLKAEVRKGKKISLGDMVRVTLVPENT